MRAIGCSRWFQPDWDGISCVGCFLSAVSKFECQGSAVAAASLLLAYRSGSNGRSECEGSDEDGKCQVASDVFDGE